METQTTVEPNADILGTDQNASPKKAEPKAKRSALKRATANGNSRAKDGKRADKSGHDKAIGNGKGKAKTKTKTNTNTKKAQLIAMLSKPNGARLAALIERLGWQSHTVRAALSGLRKQGFEVSTAKSAKGGETVYAIIAGPATVAGGKPAASA